MRKVEKRNLSVTTSVPGHLRPTPIKQLKCQSQHLRKPGRAAGLPSPSTGPEPDLGCGKAARTGLLARASEVLGNARCARNPGNGSRVTPPRDGFLNGKPKMPGI